MLEAHHLLSAVDAKTPMIIGPTTTEADEAASRATLGWMNGANVGIQRYQGVPPWEIHRDADELLYVLDGEMELIAIDQERTRTTTSVASGMIVIIPAGHWHRPVAKTMVTLFSATPFAGSDLCFDDDPTGRT